MAVSSLLFLLLAIPISPLGVTAQLQIDLTKMNECRHVAILARPSLNSTRSTPCYVPWATAQRQSVSLRQTLDPDANWTLHHLSLNGQIIYVGKGTTFFLSQKVCLDAGNATAMPMRPMYGTISGSAGPEGWIGDFRRSSRQEDIFKSCVENDVPWYNYQFKRTIDDQGTRVPRNATMYMKSHVGKHEGIGLNLVPFEFNYTEKHLEQSFQFALDQAAARDTSSLPTEKPLIVPGLPVIVYGYPFESGHTVIATESNITGKNWTDLNPDITTLAWNRLQEAVASHTGRKPPAVLLPEAITQADLLSMTVLVIVSILTFRHALLAAAGVRRERVMRWQRQCQSMYWTYVTSAADHKHLTRYPAPMQQQDLSGAFASFIVAAVTIAGAILHFRDSNVRYRNFLLIRQGGIVTYGPSDSAKWAIDKSNLYAGAVFIVGHWYVAQTVEVGFVAAFKVVLLVYCLTALSLLFYLYKFATLREHQLDKAIFHAPVQMLRAAPQAIIGGLVSYCPLASRVLGSYHRYIYQHGDCLCEPLWSGQVCSHRTLFKKMGRQTRSETPAARGG